MKPVFWFYLLIILIGVVVVALPDDDQRLVTFSDSHGPSFADAAGLVLILVPWTIMGIRAIMGWRKVLQALGRRLVTLLLTAGLAGLVVVVVSIRSDSATWWVGAALAFAGQIVPITVAFKKK